MEPAGQTRCARGGEYAYWLRRGDPKRLLVFFQGGGGCFSETTCTPGSVWFDDRVDEYDDPRWNGGILETDNPENPFRGWSIVYIPSCTGDVHTGTRFVRYGPARVYQRGFLNARAALAGAFGMAPDPDEVFVTGCSAGSVHVADRVQRRFYENGGGDSAAFPGRLRKAEAALKRLPNYRSYLACGSDHCALPRSAFYSVRVGGVRLRDWVADLARGRDVVCPTCR